MKWFFVVATLTFIVSINVCDAQQKLKTITGQVRAADDRHPLEGVTVKVKGTNNFSGSQEDGIYYIQVRPSDGVLIFTHPDYEPKEISLTHENEYNVELTKRPPK